MTFLSALYETIHGSKLSVEQIAERLGMTSPWSLYKQADPTNEQYNFPAFRLVALMRATGNYKLLHYIANQCGFVALRIARTRMRGPADLARLSELCGMATAAITRMYEAGTIDREGYELIYELLSEVAGHLKTAQKHLDGQQEFDF